MRQASLFVLFFATCLGLGYPSLARIDPARSAIDDVVHYRSMTRFDYADVPPPFRHRVLIPSIAGIVYLATSPLSLGSWSREALALLVANAATVSLTTLLLLSLAGAVAAKPGAIGVLPFLYLSTFGVVNAQLVGLVDSGETLMVVATLWLASRRRWSWLPCVFVLGVLAKETAPVFGAVLALVLLLHEGPDDRRSWKPWTAWASGVIAAVVVYVIVAQRLDGAFGARASSSVGIGALFSGLVDALASKSLVYTFVLIGPLALFGLSTLPVSWVVASAVTGCSALLLTAFAGIGENVSRPLFDTIGPVLCLAAANVIGDGLAGLGARPSKPDGE